jgi:hypothetical protein
MRACYHQRGVFWFFLFGIFLIVGVSMAETMFSGGPLDGMTGAPGEGLCTDCHSSFPVNSGDGSLQIIGLPDTMVVGQSYTITVELQDPGQQRWGFELTAIDSDGNGTGEFTIIDPAHTQLSDNPAPGRDYVKQNSAGTYQGTPDGPVTWQVNRAITLEGSDFEMGGFDFIYVAGNAADNAGGSGGDYIYTAVDSVYVMPHRVPSMNIFGILALISMIMLISVYVLRRLKPEAGP